MKTTAHSGRLTVALRTLSISLLATALAGLPERAQADIFVSNSGTTIGEYDFTTGATINANFGSPSPSITALAVSGNTLFALESNGGAVYSYDLSTGNTNPFLIPPPSGGFAGLAVSGNDLYTEAGTGGTVEVYDTTTGQPINGNLLTISGFTYQHFYLALSGNNLFVGNGGNGTNGTVGEYDATTGQPIHASLVTGISGLSGIAVSGNNLWLLQSGNVGRYNVSTGALIAPLNDSAPSQQALAVSGNDLFVVDLPQTGDNRLGEYDATTGDVINPSLVPDLGVTQSDPSGWALAASPTPEPGAAALLALGAGGILGRHRRRSV